LGGDGRDLTDWGLCGRPLLANGVEQCLVDADLPMSDEVEFVADRLFPIGHADEPRLHEGPGRTDIGGNDIPSRISSRRA
jgi:hypothetical protein